MNNKLGQPVSDDLALAIQGNVQRLAMWRALRPSCQRGYVRLITEAKRPETRQRRIERVLKMTADYYQRHHQSHQETLKSSKIAS
ncbi:MAG: hypothetical protein EXR53_05640 [Dehalococcoidia bacterium]|nr:hypothetical protein [Dehalococcoidia bacterium]